MIKKEDLETLKNLFESIQCLAFEGPEVTPHAYLFEAIRDEAGKGLKILRGEKNDEPPLCISCFLEWWLPNKGDQTEEFKEFLKKVREES